MDQHFNILLSCISLLSCYHMLELFKVRNELLRFFVSHDYVLSIANGFEMKCLVSTYGCDVWVSTIQCM